MKKANKIKGKVNKFFEKNEPELNKEQCSPTTSGTPLERMSESIDSKID